MSEMGLAEHDRIFSADEKRQALELVLQSETFSRSDQLKKFLRYVCEMDEVGHADQITEYAIGTHALGRREDYSPAADSGVRGRAHALRQKLDRFYEAERPDLTLRIGLRKGSYVPYFYESAVAPVSPLKAAPLPMAMTPTEIPLRKQNRFGMPGAFLVGCASGAILVALGLHFLTPAKRVEAVIEEFWGPLVHAGSETLLCLASPPALMIKPFPQAPSRPEIFRPVPPDVAEWYASLRLLDGGGKPYMYHSTEAPLFGSAAAAVVAAQTISAAGAVVETLPEDTLRPAALQNRNLVVIGSPNYSVYAARVLRDTPLMIREDSERGEEVITERAGGAQPPMMFVPHRDTNGDLVVCYGLITVFTNPNAAGGTRTIIVSGVTGAGTEAAMLYFSNAASLRGLLDELHKEGHLRVPASYQVVVRGSRDKAVPLTWELAAYRVMQKPPSLE